MSGRASARRLGVSAPAGLNTSEQHRRQRLRHFSARAALTELLWQACNMRLFVSCALLSRTYLNAMFLIN